MLLTIVVAPRLLAIAPPGNPELPVNVLLEILSVPPGAFSIAPPANAELPTNVTSVTSTVPPKFSIAPPPFPAATPSVNVRLLMFRADPVATRKFGWSDSR